MRFFAPLRMTMPAIRGVAEQALKYPLSNGDFEESLVVSTITCLAGTVTRPTFLKGGLPRIILKSDHEMKESFTVFRISLREVELVRNDGFGEL